MAGIPRWALIAIPVVAIAAYAVLHFTDPNVAGRADACLGTTDPIKRGVMVNTCDHPISVLACPRDSADGKCVEHTASPAEVFTVRADVAVVAHACRAPYRAAEAVDGDARECRAVE